MEVLARRRGWRLLGLQRQLLSGARPQLDRLPLPSVPVTFSYFDAERFQAEHGPTARPWELGDEGGVEEKNQATLRSKYSIDFERPVMDARQVVPGDAIRLDEQGFELFAAPTRMQPPDFYSRAQVEAVYLPECIELMLRSTGATRVIPFDYQVRNEVKAKLGEAMGYSQNAPHNDHTLVSGPRRVRELLGEDPVNDEVMRHRFAIMNLWRRWDGGNAWPLACCAYSTLDYERDMAPVDLVYRNRTGETYNVRRSDTHRFYWFSDMSKDEAIILKIYDSDPQVARGSLHTGFLNPNASPSDPPRESMEVRCILLWGPAELAARAGLRQGKVATNVEGRLRGPAGHDRSSYRK